MSWILLACILWGVIGVAGYTLFIVLTFKGDI
jgi:hypothetical protein